MKKRGALVCLLAVAWTAACATFKEEWEWENARTENTISSYRNFESRYPESSHAREARTRIEAIAWEQANSVANRQAYEAFLNEFSGSSSSYAREARTRIEAIAWEQANSVANRQAYEAFLNEFPHSSRTNETKALLQGNPLALFAADALTPDTIRKIVKLHGELATQEDVIHLRADLAYIFEAWRRGTRSQPQLSDRAGVECVHHFRVLHTGESVDADIPYICEVRFWEFFYFPKGRIGSRRELGEVLYFQGAFYRLRPCRPESVGSAAKNFLGGPERNGSLIVQERRDNGVPPLGLSYADVYSLELGREFGTCQRF